MARTFGSQPHPRLLVVSHDVLMGTSSLDDLFPTIKVVESLNEVRVLDFDVVLLLHTQQDVPDGLFVLQVGGARSSSHRRAPYSYYLDRSGQPLSRATEFSVPAGTDESIERVATSVLWPLIDGAPEKSVVGFVASTGPTVAGNDEVLATLRAQFHPLLVDSDQRAVAAWLERGNEDREWWSVPMEVSDYEPWLRMLVDRWRRSAPDRFPVRVGGYDNPAWQTTGEWEAAQAIATLDEERATYELEHAARRKDAEAEMLRASEAASRSSRRLLTETGPELEAAVEDALKLIGFDVEPQDTKGRQLREDFRVRQPGNADWIALVEVKGLTNGASPSVFGQVSRHEVNFAAETGSPASGVVIVVNHFRHDPPGDRPRVLGGQPEEVENFASHGYRIIDSRDLFAAIRDIEAGSKSSEDVRRAIVERTGALDLNLQHNS